MLVDRRRLLAGLAAVPVIRSTPARARSDEAGPAGAVLEAAFATHTPVGLAGAIIGREGVSWASARGLRSFGDAAPVTTADSWHLGSNTKAMTAAVFARLVRQGRARWTMAVGEAFPGIEIDAGWASATLDDFMHHRAGLTDAAVMGREWLMTARQDPRSLAEQRAAIAARALAAPPPGTPGQFAYGNANYVLVGAAIERIAGEAWEEAMRRELFGPLGLSSAGFGAPRGDNPRGHRGAGADRTPMPAEHPGADNPAALGPAGTVHMNLADYGRFLGAMMGARPDWLDGDALARLTTPPAGDPPAYACGWGVRRQPWGGVSGPGPVLGHDGSNTMWHSSVQLAPERGVAAVAVTNEGAAGRSACQDLVQRLIGTALSA